MFSKMMRNKILGVAFIFTSGLFLYERLLLPFRANDFVEQLSSIGGISIQLISFIAACLFYYAAWMSTKRWRILYFLIFTLSILTEYGYCFAMGRFSLTQDYMIGFQAIDFDLLRSAAVTFIGGRFQSVPPILIFGATLAFFPTRNHWGLKQFFVLIIVLVLTFSGIYPFSRGTYPTVSISASWRTLTFTGWKIATTYRGSREGVESIAGVTPKNNIVFVVDESVRCDHLSINGYSRDTTPFLQELQEQGYLVNWGAASAGGTVSLTSNLLLLAGTTDLSDPTQNYLREPTIFQYAKAVGYETFLLDAQLNYLWQMRQSDLEFVDHWITANQFQSSGREYVDIEAARYIRSQIQGATGKFFWINKMGVHFHYASHYPAAEAKWPADPYTQYDPSQIKQIIDNYDSALAFNLDSFIKQITAGNGLENTIIVYTSDHGQTLTEGGETWPHNGSSRSEACVPLFIISKPALLVEPSFQASHANLFPTILDLMEIPQAARKYPYAISLLKATKADNSPRHFLNGSVDSRYGSRVYDFDQP